MIDQLSQLVPSQMELDQIYLDPNNPRFAQDGRPYVRDEETDQAARQDELMSKMEQEYAVDRLKDSIESNGYLPIDRIIVREFKDDKYVVLEGNRRVTAAKRLVELHKTRQHELIPEVYKSLLVIPVLVYTGQDPDAAWLFQGIRHISGVKDWAAYNKAKLLVDQIEKNEMSLAEAGRIFGISAWGAGQWVRGFYAYRQAQNHPDFHRDVSPVAYPIFQELFGRSDIALKQWMCWNEGKNEFDNEDHFGEFLSWLYPKSNENGEFDPDLPGDWEKRRIPRALDLRLVSELIAKYPDEFLDFRNGTSLAIAHGRASAKEQDQAKDTDDYVRKADNFRNELQQLPIMKIMFEGKQSLLRDKLQELIPLIQHIQRVLKDE